MKPSEISRWERLAREQHKEHEHVASWLTCVRCADLRRSLDLMRSGLRVKGDAK